MVRLAISVEGQTEERFIQKLLQPYFEPQGIYIQPILFAGRGGDISLAKIKKELNNLASNFERVTTLYDFYGFRGKEGSETKETLEQKILNSVAEPLRDKVIPYVQMYEFEGLLFSSPDAIENTIGQKGLSAWATSVLADFGGNPEKINNSAQTAPSKRLLAESSYAKTIHGPNIAIEIGLDGLRKKCSGFNDWLSQLESL